MTGTVLAVEALGVRVEIDLAALEPADRDRLRTAWARATVAGPAPPDQRVVRLPGSVLVPHRGFLRGADNLSSQLTIAAIRERGGDLVLLHAAGLAEPGTGRTVAFVGPSGRGKSTLTRALGALWGYVSDETVGVDPATLRVAPHPKPLSIKTATAPGESWGSFQPKEQLGPDELGLRVAPADCRLAKVVLLDRDPGHRGPPCAEPTGIARAVGTLTSELSYVSRWERPLAAAAGLIADTGGALRLCYAEADAVPEILPDLPDLGAPTDWWSVEVDGSGAEARGEAGVTTARARWVRGTAREAIADPETVAILHRHDGRDRVTVLDGIGPILWDLAHEPVSTADLTAAVLDQIGPPPTGSGADVVTAAIKDLAAQGLLVAA